MSETASYGTLEAYLNDIGKALKPRVTCIINIKNRGAGIPDGGFFTQDQIRKEKPQEETIIQTAPARGVMEVKGVSEDVRRVAQSEQVKKYLAKYGQVLVTTYREFVLVVKGDNGGSATVFSHFRQWERTPICLVAVWEPFGRAPKRRSTQAPQSLPRCFA